MKNNAATDLQTLRKTAELQVGYTHWVKSLVGVKELANTPEFSLSLLSELRDIERSRNNEDPLENTLAAQIMPSFAVSEQGLILRAHPAVLSRLPILANAGHSVESIGITADAFAQFRARLQHSAEPRLLMSTESPHAPPLVYLAYYHAVLRVFIFTIIQHQWSCDTENALTELYGLSATESDILSGLARGLSAEQIATDRHRAVGTIRQQIKSLLKKLNVSSHVQAAAIAATAAAALARQPPRTLNATLPTHNEHLPMVFGQTVREGRRIGYRRFGRKQGLPVLWVHGSYFGAGELTHDRQLADDLNLHVLAIERPGYGRTSAPNIGSSALHTSHSDIAQVLAELAFTPKAVLAHDHGIDYALYAMQHNALSATPLLGVAPKTPFAHTLTEAQSLCLLPEQMHALWQVSTLTPMLLPAALRLAQIRLQRLGGERWIEDLYTSDSAAFNALQQQPKPDRYALLQFITQQNGKGWALDLALLSEKNLSRHLESAAEFTLLYGMEDAAIIAPLVQTWHSAMPDTEMKALPSAGQALALTHAEQQWTLLKGLATR